MGDAFDRVLRGMAREAAANTTYAAARPATAVQARLGEGET